MMLSTPPGWGHRTKPFFGKYSLGGTPSRVALASLLAHLSMHTQRAATAIPGVCLTSHAHATQNERAAGKTRHTA